LEFVKTTMILMKTSASLLLLMITMMKTYFPATFRHSRFTCTVKAYGLSIVKGPPTNADFHAVKLKVKCVSL